MRRSFSLIGTLLLLAAVTRAMSPEELVKRSQVIVRATAVGYFRPPTLQRAGRGPLIPRESDVVAGAIRFHVDKVIKGKMTGEFLDLPGRLVTTADANEQTVPYRNARKSPDTYVAGTEYLLMLRDNGNGADVSWAAPSASNEPIRGENDPWVSWVEKRVAKESR